MKKIIFITFLIAMFITAAFSEQAYGGENMANYREDIISIELANGNVHRGFLQHSIGGGDKKADRFGVRVYRNGQPETLTGTCFGLFVRSDGATVTINNGTIVGNVAYVELPENCYEVEGVFTLAIKVTTADDTVTLRIVDGNVSRTSTNIAVDPGTVTLSIDDLIAAITEAVDSIPEDYSSLTQTAEKEGSYREFVKVKLNDMTLGKSIQSGVYTDAAYGYENLRAATQAYYTSGNYMKIVPLTGYKVEVDFYNDSKVFVGYEGWITEETIIKPKGKYFRVVAGGDTNISEVYTTIANIYTQSEVYDTNRKAEELNTMYGGTANMPAWIEGKFPHYTRGEIWSNAEYKYSPKVRIVGGAKYVYTGVMNSVCGILFYDEDMNLITGTGTNQNTFTAPENAAYADVGTRYLETEPMLMFYGEKYNIDTEMVEELETPEEEKVLNTALQPNADTGAHVDLDVEEFEEYLVTGYCYVHGTYPIVIFLNGNTLISYDNLVATTGGVTDAKVVIPHGANRMIVNGKPREIVVKKVATNVKEGVEYLSRSMDVLKNFSGKKIVWFGTSIPANGWFGYEHPMAYPQQVGRLIGAEVINEAIGSSCIHCKDPARISESNPYGFKTGFESCSRCLTNTDEEQQWIIDHYDSGVWTEGVPAEMTEWLADKIHSFGYEEKLDKYLTAETFPDLFVFDHGFNDSSDTNNYYQQYGKYNKYTFRGGMNFLIKRILDYNPYANIVIIGNYTTTRDVPQMQEAVAEDWALPICRQWEMLGLTLTEDVTAKGYWYLNNGEYEWIEDGTARTYSMRDRLIPDHVHPHSNPTGAVVKKMALCIAKWMMSNVPGFTYDE